MAAWKSWKYHGCIGNTLYLGCTLAEISTSLFLSLLLARSIMNIMPGSVNLEILVKHSCVFD